MSGGGESLDSLLFGDDDDDDMSSSSLLQRNSSSTVSMNPLPPPASAIPLAPPVSSSSSGSGSALVGRMFDSIKARVSPDVFTKIKAVASKYPGDQKGLMQHIRSLVGETIFKTVVQEVRSTMNAPAASSSSNMIPMPASTISSTPMTSSLIPPPASLTPPPTRTSATPPNGGGSAKADKSKLFSDMLMHSISCLLPISQCTV